VIDDDEPVDSALRKSAEEIKAHPEQPLGGLIQNALFLPGTSQDIPLEVAKPGNFKPHKIRIYFGTVTYDDVFRQKHTTHYCIRLGNFCETGNDAD